MARVKTFTNGGSLLPSDLNSIEDDYEFAFSTYKVLIERGGLVWQASSTANQVYITGVTASGAGLLPPTTSVLGAFYLDPADFLANTRVTKLRLRLSLFTNAVAPAANFTCGLYPVATWNGASGASPGIASLGAVVAGSAPAAINTPGANSQTQVVGADFTCPAAGWYVIGAMISAVPPANSIASGFLYLECRQV